MLRAILVLSAALGTCAFVTWAQPADKKIDAAKTKDESPKGKPKDPDKAKAIDKKPLAKPAWPKDGGIVVDDWLEALTGQAKMYLLTPERHQELLDQIDALKRQLKPERMTPSWCKLNAEQDGDFLIGSADYDFRTETPKTLVLLGLKGGFLTEGSHLDGQTPYLEYDKDDGFLVRVEKEGVHKAHVSFRVPIKKSASFAEREVEMVLPGSASTTLNLKLASNIKEVRANNVLEKADPPGRWSNLGLGTGKKLHLVWKEPSASGNAPLIKVEGQIQVTVDEKDVHITADLALEDSQRQTKDWRMLVPATAEVELVKAPGGLTGTILKPTPKTPYHVLKASDVTADTWKVKVTQHIARPASGLPVGVGPFHVLDAAVHKGTIVVQMPPSVSFGQRLIFTRAENTYLKSAEADSVFTYVAPAVADKNLKSMKTLT
ncbi:MAG: hypothetical protein HYR84_05230, partial [Planctomycetes bacterium]|nr:hypothetical protein [Planctomycetota bacterium]